MDRFRKLPIPKSVTELTGTEEVYINNKYTIDLRHLEHGWTHLSIKANNKQAIHDWRDFQTIKNELCGKEREAIELYPAESRLVDSSNQYHVWVMPKGEQFPFGWTERFIVKGHKKSEGLGSVQRPFKETPKDAISVEEANEKQLKFLSDHNP